jgi:serine protease AprX
MPISLPPELIEYILLGPAGDRRLLQDSPILVDVWRAFAKEPDKAQELLITPHRDQTAGIVATKLNELIQRPANDPADIAYLQGIIAARLYFGDLLSVIVPRTEWWISPRNKKDMEIYLDPEKREKQINEAINNLVEMAAHWGDPDNNSKVDKPISALDRYAALAGLILWVGSKDPPLPKKTKKDSTKDPTKVLVVEAIKNGTQAIVDGLQDLFKKILQDSPIKPEQELKALVYQVSLNREATMALARSVPAVKADAARVLFAVNCSKIAWAVIDSGIQGDHPAFMPPDGESRVKASFDFSNFRKIVSLDNLRILNQDATDKKMKAQRLKEILRDGLKNKLSEKEAITYLTRLANDAKEKRPIHWESIRPFIEINIEERPISDHGSHVAGIIGACKTKDRGKTPGEDTREDMQDDNVDGMCPAIQLYDFRVLAPSIKETEFAIIAALQYIRHMNEQNEFVSIHGANLSLSIPHDVRNYACGLTPVCVECERLVGSGVVVVAAAGNSGYHSYQTKEGLYEGYAQTSITDPGNADGVITVGATHRYSPHTYGVSFFSSRGPTGDGRLKPDIVAPGERIHAPFRKDWGDLDGTSMAAPHVSGAAAMLMARFSEFIGQPRRIKEILCQSATDLGRERSFQGHGMLDVLRAFQSL